MVKRSHPCRQALELGPSSSSSSSKMRKHKAKECGTSAIIDLYVVVMLDRRLKVYGAVSSGAESLRTKLAGDDGYESDKDGYKGESHLCRIMRE